MSAIANLLGYQITEQLYTGTRTLVYRGIRSSDTYPVVIKILRNEYPDFTEALHYLYQNRVIHKDIKPANILINLSLENALEESNQGQVYAKISNKTLVKTELSSDQKQIIIENS